MKLIKRSSVGGVVAAALVVLTGCGASTTNSPAEASKSASPSTGGGYDGRSTIGAPTDAMPEVKPSTTCPRDGGMGGLPYGVGERVTASWKVSWVLRCRFEQQRITGQGLWNVVITERADGSPETLLKELAKPDVPTPSGMACPMFAMLIPWFVLVDDKGKPHFAHIPTVVCGQPSPAAVTALNALPFKVVKTERVSLAQSELSMQTGCVDQWKDIISLTAAGPSTAPVPSGVPIDPGFTGKGTPQSGSVPGSTGSDREPIDPGMTGMPVRTLPPDGPVASAGSSGGGAVGWGSASAGSASAGPGTVVSGSVVTASPGTVVPPSPPAPHFCVYRTDNEVGTLVRGRNLQTGELTTVLKGVGGPIHPCGVKHTLFAVVFGSDQGDWTIELDGCTRSVSPSGTFGQASDAALAVLQR